MERKIAAVRGLPAEALAKAGPTRSTVQGSSVVRGVLLAVLATAVLPPAGAWWLNSRRVAITADRVAALVPGFSGSDGGGVVCGPGRLPDTDVRGAHAIHAAWITAAVSRPEAFGAGAPTDAWGRCFLASDRWVLSAGPNGVVDTPLDAQALGGDDIGVRVR
jgi:hypothetical protein